MLLNRKICIRSLTYYNRKNVQIIKELIVYRECIECVSILALHFVYTKIINNLYITISRKMSKN